MPWSRIVSAIVAIAIAIGVLLLGGSARLSTWGNWNTFN